MFDLSRTDLNLLVVFDALMEERQVTRAAARIRLTQPAVSHALKRLRELFGDALFTRGPGGIHPTPHALDLHVPVRAALAHAQAALGSRRHFDAASATRSFCLAMTEVMSVEVMPHLIALVRQRAPGVTLMVRASGAGEAAEFVARGEADIGLGVVPRLPEGVVFQELYSDTLVCVVDREHPKLRKGRMRRQDYLAAAHVAVAGQRQLGMELDELMRRIGIERRIVAVLPHYVAIPAVVVGTDLVGHVRQRLVAMSGHAERLRTFHPPVPAPIPPLRFLQLWHLRDENDAGHRWMRGMIAEAARGGDRPTTAAGSARGTPPGASG